VLGLFGGLAVLLWARAAHTPWKALGFVRPRSWLAVVLGGIAFGAVLKLLLKSVLLPLVGAPATNATYHGLVGNTAALPMIAFTMIVIAGVGEELVMRGWLFDRLGHWWGRGALATVATVGLSTLLFAALHLQDQGVPGAEQALVTGLAFGALYAATRQIAPVMIAHAAYDLLAVAIIYAGWETRLAHLFVR